MKRLFCILFVPLFICFVCSACSNAGPVKEVGPEIGKWHATISLNCVNDESIAEEDKLMLSMLAGDTLFEIDAEFFEDGTFSYEINTDKLEESISKTVNTVLGFFVKYDVSLFVERLVNAATKDTVHLEKMKYYGTYSKDNNTITAVDEYYLFFNINDDTLSQIDGDGSIIAIFYRVTD